MLNLKAWWNILFFNFLIFNFLTRNNFSVSPTITTYNVVGRARLWRAKIIRLIEHWHEIVGNRMFLLCIYTMLACRMTSYLTLSKDAFPAFPTLRRWLQRKCQFYGPYSVFNFAKFAMKWIGKNSHKVN